MAMQIGTVRLKQMDANMVRLLIKHQQKQHAVRYSSPKRMASSAKTNTTKGKYHGWINHIERGNKSDSQNEQQWQAPG